MIVAGALLLDRVANSHLHHLAPLSSNNFFRPPWMKSLTFFLATGFRGPWLHGRRRTGRQLNAGIPPLINPAFPRTEGWQGRAAASALP